MSFDKPEIKEIGDKFVYLLCHWQNVNKTMLDSVAFRQYVLNMAIELCFPSATVALDTITYVDDKSRELHDRRYR
jgi:hypothetical protein